MANRHRIFVIAVNLTYAALLLVIGLSSDVPDVAEGISDHAAHILASAIHAGLIFIWLRRLTGLGKASILAATAATLYGGLIEMLQLTQSTRSFEAADLAANAIGACSISLFIYLVARLQAKGSER